MARAAVLGRLTWQVGMVTEIRKETATASTIMIDVPGWPGNAAGQPADVRLTAEDGYSTERSYSIASAPSGTRIELTVQRLDDGEVSPYLTEVLTPGNPLELRGPIGGYFAWHPGDPQPVLLIGGGSGVVQLMAMARTRTATASTAPMQLIYSTRSPDTLLYAGELQRIAAPGTGPGIDIVYTREAPAGWPGPVGRLDARQLLDLAGPPPAGQQCFICGPTGFVESAARLLVDQGLADRQIKTERFGPSGGTP